MSDDADGYALAHLGDALHEVERERDGLAADILVLRAALQALCDATEPLDREWVYERLNELQGDIFDAARERAGVVLGGGNDG